MLRLFHFAIGLLLFSMGACVMFFIFAFVSMVNPALSAVDARLMILEKMFTFSNAAVGTIAALACSLVGLWLMINAIAPARRTVGGRHEGIQG